MSDSFQIHNTKKYCQDVVAETLSRLLDLSDAMVDKYVAIQSESNGQAAHCGKCRVGSRPCPARPLTVA